MDSNERFECKSARNRDRTVAKTAKRILMNQQVLTNLKQVIRPKIYILTDHLSIEKDRSRAVF